MAERIIKDIRYYESDKPNTESHWPGELGRIFKPTTDTKYIGQRIARKLNELGFSYQEYDHICINLTAVLSEHQITVSNRNIDKRVKYIDYGLSPAGYNFLSDYEKDKLLKSITFKVLKQLNFLDNSSLKHIEKVEYLIAEVDAEIQINYKTKETSNYKIEISYQIGIDNNSTKAIVAYLDKKSGLKTRTSIPLSYYEYIYYLIDTISLKDNTITFNPKKSTIAGFANNKYNTPIVLAIDTFETI